ncbi:MAG: hypothetical protein CM15mP39_10070 [Synechococcus sp.]|nr:MAG: hypothetical protein CM15mP39_10070 [Synechococcus sp.]|tara:strand:+ start:543 stop:689 length:147 start_codon:yes stop_codon:yes gene_type:complete
MRGAVSRFSSVRSEFAWHLGVSLQFFWGRQLLLKINLQNFKGATADAS